MGPTLIGSWALFVFRWKLFPNRCTRINWFLAELRLARAATSTLRPSCFFATLSPMNRSKSGECAYQKSTTQNMRTRGLSPENPLTIWKILMHSSHAHCAISRGWSATTASAARCSSAAIERYWKLWKAGGGNLEPWDAIGIIGIIRTYVESCRDHGGQHVIASALWGWMSSHFSRLTL